MKVETLNGRSKLVRAIRRFVDDQGFVEVETAVRIPAPAPEEHIDCPPVVGGGYLRASPELQMKKLLAGGMDRIYQIGPCFREGEKGSRHNPEFTMIEWYRRKADYLDIRNDLEILVSRLFAGNREQGTGNRLDLSTSQLLNFSTLKVRDAYRDHAGWDPWTEWDQDRFDFDMATKIEPAIKSIGGGVFLMDYPPQAASLAKLSRPSKHPNLPDFSYAERWEFYWDGLELANCFTELCDRDEQLKRFEKAKDASKLLKESDYPLYYEFIYSLSRIEHAAGVALGIDRLVMILTQTKEISAVRAHI